MLPPSVHEEPTLGRRLMLYFCELRSLENSVRITPTVHTSVHVHTTIRGGGCTHNSTGRMYTQQYGECNCCICLVLVYSVLALFEHMCLYVPPLMWHTRHVFLVFRVRVWVHRQSHCCCCACFPYMSYIIPRLPVSGFALQCRWHLQQRLKITYSTLTSTPLLNRVFVLTYDYTVSSHSLMIPPPSWLH